jgi:hypothetical protein
MGHRRAALRIQPRNFPILQANLGQRLPQNALAPHGRRPGDRQIILADLAPGEVVSQGVIGTRRLGEQQQATAPPIESMQQTEVPRRTEAAQSRSCVGHRAILDRIRPMPHPGQAHQPAGLGDEQDFLIFPHNLERDRGIRLRIVHKYTLTEPNRQMPGAFTRSTRARNRMETFGW